ncbi:MBL fold metallo-hydrolase [Marinivivus vitaminiproducens]|uniref:MBL fold metallo-hydrolase n=1 Tax=Marinivivus vitaminiproducens TaxID=3035935 RepID=UPI00279F6242|nr:MBL fold metallo-hydrolase [Geminicoccaceae bacterium SCSIO 64248]
MPIDRRDFMAGAAVALAGGALGVPGMAPSAAAATQGGNGMEQAPGFYRFTVGEAIVTTINDGVGTRSLEAGFVRNAELADVQGALAEAFQPAETITIPFTLTVIERGGRVVMIDSGTGGLLAPTAGRAFANLTAAGYPPERIDTLVVSHFHGDHIQGIRAKDGSANFPNATILVPDAEWAFWMDEGAMSRAPEAMKSAFESVHRVFDPIAGSVERYQGETEIVPGLRSLPAYGHTPGHTVFVLADGDASLLIWSDTTNKPELFVRNPSWQAVFDMDGDQAAATRARMLDMAASERMRLVGYHFPFPATGYIGREGQGYRYVPAFWQPGVD